MHVPALSTPARRLAVLLLLCGVALTALDIHGALTGPAPHRLAGDATAHKGSLALRPPTDMLAALDDTPVDLSSESGARFVTRTFAAGIRHYWPQPGEVDPDVFYGFDENWIIASMQHAELALFEAGLIGRARTLRLERWHYEPIVRKGVGFCSQASVAVADFLRSRGLEPRVVLLGGHVVTEATLGGHEYVLDADYGVTIPHSMAEIERDPRLVERYYLAAGYSPRSVHHLADLYGPAGNGPYLGSGALVIRILEILKWVLPLAMVAAALAVLARGTRAARSAMPAREESVSDQP